MSEALQVTIDGHVAEVMLNRPARLNALDIDTFVALDAAARSIAADGSVRAVVLHGAGENFCSGIDLEALAAGGEKVAATLLRPVEGSAANLAQRAAYAWRELPVPVICALRGVAFGGGFQVAMGADLRYAAPEAKFSIMESKWGLIPDMAISTTLRGIVAPDRVKELAFLADVFGADEALRIGAVTRICEDPLAAARATAAAIAERSPDAIRGVKRLVNEAWALPEADCLALEAAIQVRILGGPNQAEAVSANLEKRRPKFAD
ncbi:MAG: crotonase/enoyl-CoA hydratase family protein [Gammaproteobacteria bacterium]|nr:crotonase/enoyl-CoA hydratase family protein [Gammaproteobacteria bacterium]NNF50396.1 crotonase/enoyl-CoA hydratase family protein [Woeseiaceae bacterium]MBT8093692.1 crotonase/enoyl-CoA hydratase family protein [Gammaproteobacteria bacterium]MBT8104738.1 crotonase/enoyl-CoA hydratase family protein [Gammaproteobacteria bacterium]NNK24752.1 crotonase/enoyl-CoA hydratase family protein [Woeseiaceae bacterium]